MVPIYLKSGSGQKNNMKTQFFAYFVVKHKKTLDFKGLLGETPIAILGPHFGPLYVQRALCTVKAVSKTYRQPSARLQFVFAVAPISIHILGPWSLHAPFWYHFGQSRAQGCPDVSKG